jgi:hypothetical protein
VAAFYATQFAIALVIWGPVALATHKRFAANVRYSVHGLPQMSPAEIFVDSVVKPSFALPLPIAFRLLHSLLLCRLDGTEREEFIPIQRRRAGQTQAS